MLRQSCGALSACVAVAALSTVATADVNLDLVPSQSTFAPDGTCSLGALCPPGLGLVHMDGDVDLEFIPGPGNQLFARIVAMQMITVDDIVLGVGCPPTGSLATVAVEDLQIFLDSNAFARGPGGQVDMQVFGSILGGHVTITVSGIIVGQADLAGADIGIVARTGGLNPGGAGAGVMLDLPLEIAIDCGDVGSVSNLNLGLDGHVLATHTFPAPVTYCTASVTPLGCSGAISASGNASATLGSGFVVQCTNVRNQKAGLLFYGTNGRAQAPFQGGTLCVRPPLTRTPLQYSGGSNPPAQNCTGHFALDFNAWVAEQGVASSVGLPGTVVDCQWYSRDPSAASTVALSNALEFTIGL